MKLSTNLSLFTTLLAVFALPISASSIEKRGYCLGQYEANAIVSKFASILAQTGGVATANATAQALLANDYIEFSDSILSLEGLPLGGPLAPSKQAYIALTLSQPPINGITTIEVLLAGCNKVLWYWNFLGVGSGKFEVKGFNLFTVNGQRQIEQTDSEFNSLAWAEDVGFTVVPPGSA